jgi:hypothetical protein
MRRTFIVPIVLGLLSAAMPLASQAAVPEGYRVISDRHADGYAASSDGCLLTEAYFGSGSAIYGGRPGPVNKQAGPTDVLVIVSDTCAEPVGKGYPQLAAWQGQAMIGLESSAQFDHAWVHAAVPVYDDVTGTESVATTDMSWTSTGRATPDPTHLHVRFPGIAVANSHDNDTLVDAVATGTIEIDGLSLSVASTDARLSTVKAGCQVITHPGAENPDVSCL